MKQIHYFEEEYGQIEVVPEENNDYIHHKIEKISRLIQSNNNQLCGGPEDFPPESEIRLDQMGITMLSFEKAMKGIQKFDKVFWGESEDYECPDVLAFGNSQNTIVFIEVECQIVSKIWLTLNIYDEDDYIEAEKLLNALSTLADLLIVDWGWLFFEHLTATESIQSYIKQRMSVFQKMKKQ